MKTALFLAAALLLAVTGTLGGRITPWADADMYYPNSGRVQYMNLYFQLDNRLPAGHVLRITLPFTTSLALNSSATASTSTVYLASSFSKGTFSNTAAASLTVAATPSFVKLSSGAPYTAHFTLNNDLSAATPYVFKLVFSTSPSDSAGFLGYVQMETLSPAQSIVNTSSTLSDTGITYDLNNAFAPVQLFAAPGTNTTFTINSDANSTVAGATSVRQISIVPSANFFYWPLLQITWENSNFTVSNLVSVDSGVNTTTPVALAAGTAQNQYSYTQSGTTINLFHNAPLLTNQTVKYNITTVNVASQTITFSLKILHRYNNNLTDIVTATGIAVQAASGGSAASTTVAFNSSAYQILLSWGIDAQSASLTAAGNALSKVFTLYASDTTNMIFQAVRFGFGLNGTLSTGSYQVNVTICTTNANCDVLENSLYTNMQPSTGCFFNWGYGTVTTKYIACNVTTIAQSGNQIGGRIWLASAMGTTATDHPTTFTDSSFGTISIASLTNTSFVTLTQSLPSGNNAINVNTPPLVNINGNGPLAGIPATANLATPVGTTKYSDLWTTIAPSTAADFAVYSLATSSSTSTATRAGSMMGGIYGVTATNTKYNLALFTNANFLGTTSSFGVNAASGALAGVMPGIDIFMNPNIYSFGGSASGTTSVVTSCWAAKQASKAADLTTTPYTSTVATETAALPSAHCFTNNFAATNTNYLRLRFLITSTATNLLSFGGSDAPGIDAAATSKYMTFYWENAVTIASSYAGASLKADSNAGDFYGVMYTLTPPASPTFPIKSGGTNPVDIGELNSTATSGFTYAYGTSFFWSQMIMAPYGISITGTDSANAYYNKKSVFLGGYAAYTSAPASTGYNTATQVQLIRIRGLLNSDKDTGLYPSTGKIALFIGHFANIFEPLAGANVTNFNGAPGYNQQTGVPLVGNGAVRCWNNGIVGNCVHERYGRTLPTAIYAASNTANGATTPLDYYQIINSDAGYSATNFSVAILIKPLLGVAADFAKHYYRFGFVSNSSSYYIQSFDQFFDNGATTTAATGAVTAVGQPFAVGAAASVLAPTGTACNYPYSTTNGAVTPGIRITPNANDVDNNVASANITLNVQAYGATGVTPSKLQGHVIWCGQWNFRVNSPNVTSTVLENTATADRCATFDYLTAETATSPPAFYCIYCPISGSTAVPATGAPNLVANISNFWDGPAQNINSAVITNLVGDLGVLVENSNCASVTGTTTPIWTPQTITISTAPSSYYAISGQKITIQFNAPSTLATTLVDTITITGRINGTSTADTSFPYGSLDANSVCRLVPTSSIGNYSSYVTCTATVGSNAITISSIGTITSTASQWTLYIWGFIGGTAAANTTASYLMQTYKSSTTYIVDQSSTTNTAYAQWALSNTTSALSLVLPVYQRPYVGARGWFKFDIGFAPRTWFYSDKVVVNLDAVGSATVNANASVVKCRITDTSDAINYGFQSCTLSLGASPTVTILAMQPSGTTYPYDFATGNGVRVYLDNMVTTTQTTKMIYGSVAFAGSGSGSATVLSKVISATTTDISPTTLSTTAFPTGFPTVTKLWYSANDFQDLVFNFPTSTVFNSSCRIAIVFPSYYNPGLITRSNAPYCTINNVYTQCLVGDVSSSGVATLAKGQHQLIIYGFSGSVSAGGTVSVRVGGISAPLANYTAETFWVQINGDNTDSASTLMYGGSVTDQSYVTPTASVFPLNVVWFAVGATATRSTTAFTWSFGLNNATATVGTSSAIQAIFPESWGLAWGEFAPTCQIIDFTSNITTYSAAISASTGNNSIFGNLVTMNISTAIPAGAVVNLTCSGVRTPGLDGYYRSQDVQIRVVDANGTFTYLRSAPGQHNVNFTYYFSKGSSQSYVSWADASNFTNPLPLTAGTYNLKVTATVPSKATRSFTMTPSNTQFAFLSSTAPFWIVTGATSNSTNLGCAQTVPVGVYALYFSVSDNSSTYVAPPVMWVNVNNNAQVITPSATTLTTYFQSTSVVSTTAPLVFDLTNFPPYSDITITPNVTVSGNTNFTFTPASIRLTAAAPKAYFTFSSTATASATGSSSYTFTLSGTNAAAYSLPSTVTVNLQSDSGSGAVNTPVLTVAADTTTDTFSPTIKPLLFTLTQVTQATVYWVITLQGQSITDINTIVTNAAALTQYSAQSANQAQYFTNFLVASARNSLTVSNLWPNTGYTVSAVAVSQTSRNSTVATFSFATGVNGAPVQRWLFNYTTYPVLSVRQSLLCTITQTLAVPASNVRDVNGEICGNGTSFYANQNSTGDLAIYFYPLQASADTTMTATNLNTILNATDAVRQAFNSSLNSAASNTGFLNIWSDFAYIPRQAPNLTIPTTIAASSLTTSSINLALASINETGFLFVALCSNTSTAPTAVQMKQAAANISSITGLVSLQVIYYYPGAVPTYNFTGLSTATSYNLYVAAGNNDPSFLQNFTAVTTIPVTTASTNSGSSASQIGVILSVMTVFASVISLMFF